MCCGVDDVMMCVCVCVVVDIVVRYDVCRIMVYESVCADGVCVCVLRVWMCETVMCVRIM